MIACDTSDPVLLFRSVVTAINAGSWGAVAAACDPDSLLRFRNWKLEEITQQSTEEPVPLTAELLLRGVPEMPVAVAHEIVAEQAQRTTKGTRLPDWPAWAASSEAARALTPLDFFARSFESVMPQARIARLAASGAIDAAEVASALELSLFELRVVALGAVPDGNAQAQVVYRDALGASLADTGYVRWLDGLPEGGRALYEDLGGHRRIRTETALRQPDGSWRLTASTDLAGVGSLAVAYDTSSARGTHVRMYESC